VFEVSDGLAGMAGSAVRHGQPGEDFGLTVPVGDLVEQGQCALLVLGGFLVAAVAQVHQAEQGDRLSVAAAVARLAAYLHGLRQALLC
jgi:hypothetical protein